MMKKSVTVFKTCLFLIFFTSVRLLGAVNACNLPESVSVSVDTTCSGDNDISFQVDVILPTAPINDYYYQWSKEGIIISDASLTSELTLFFVEELDAGTYSLKVSEGHPDTSLCFMEACTDLIVGTSTLILNDPESLYVCEQSNTIMQVHAFGDNLTYQWRREGSIISGAINDVFEIVNFSSQDQGVYSVEIIGDCGTDTEVITSLIRLDTEYPNVTLGADKETICQDEDVIFTAFSTAGGSAPTYEFFNGTTSIQGPSEINTLELSDIQEDVIIEVEMTSNSTCVDPSVVNPVSSSISINVDSIIDPSFSIAPIDTQQVGSDITIQLESIIGFGPFTIFIWEYEGQVSFTTIESSLRLLNLQEPGGELKIRMVSRDGCVSGEFSNQLMINVVDDLTGLNQIISVGNQNSLFIEGLEGYASIELSVFDLNGKQVEQVNLNNEEQWKPENYNLGTYVYRVKYDENKTRRGTFILVE